MKKMVFQCVVNLQLIALRMLLRLYHGVSIFFIHSLILKLNIHQTPLEIVHVHVMLSRDEIWWSSDGKKCTYPKSINSSLLLLPSSSQQRKTARYEMWRKALSSYRLDCFLTRGLNILMRHRKVIKMSKNTQIFLFLLLPSHLDRVPRPHQFTKSIHNEKKKSENQRF